jgi:hypothetical protein
MEDLAPNDRIFASIVMGILHPDYDPNRHWANTITIRSYLRRLQ